jgi:acetoin utilization protein AcuC
MYEAFLWSIGASITAAEMVSSGQIDVAFNCSGGLHHAMPTRASGFCILNDPVISIDSLLSWGLRVAYVDIDAHQGDGVQHAFYNSDQVLIISLDQSRAYFFLGTGFVLEMGETRALATLSTYHSIPPTNDDIYLWASSNVVPPLVQAFKPDILVTQLGMDSHLRDPITQFCLTVQGHARLVAELGQMTSRWLAIGGGG